VGWPSEGASKGGGIIDRPLGYNMIKFSNSKYTLVGDGDAPVISIAQEGKTGGWRFEASLNKIS
jgi:hypothetical protein